MDIATLVGLVLGVVALLAAFVMEGGNPASLIGPTAIMIVFGGTIGATMISHSLGEVLRFPTLVLKAIKSPPDHRAATVDELVKLAEVARREGLLALENHPIEDPFLKKAVLMVVDGSEPDAVRDILTIDSDALEARHERGHQMLATMGGFAPTMGIIGTVMGLIHVLSSLDNPDELGPSIAVAFLATLYGVGSANLLFLPLGNKLKLRTQNEVDERTMVIEGVLALQSGDNPRVIREKLAAFLSPAERNKASEAAERPAAAPAGVLAGAEGGR